ncbi:MAG: hypothetical protein JO326_03410, partial [Acetobacteraceae bacterium]|nr:hypothetical protein [Acetobacteraceae bacterium]
GYEIVRANPSVAIVDSKETVTLKFFVRPSPHVFDDSEDKGVSKASLSDILTDIKAAVLKWSKTPPVKSEGPDAMQQVALGWAGETDPSKIKDVEIKLEVYLARNGRQVGAMVETETLMSRAA